MLLVLCGLCRQNAEPGEADKQRVAKPPPNSPPPSNPHFPWWPPDISLWKCNGQEGINIPPSQSEAQQQLHAITGYFSSIQATIDSWPKWSNYNQTPSINGRWVVVLPIELAPFFGVQFPFFVLKSIQIQYLTKLNLRPQLNLHKPIEKTHLFHPNQKHSKPPADPPWFFAARTPCASAWSSGASGTPWRTSPTCSAACVRWKDPGGIHWCKSGRSPKCLSDTNPLDTRYIGDAVQMFMYFMLVLFLWWLQYQILHHPLQ